MGYPMEHEHLILYGAAGGGPRRGARVSGSRVGVRRKRPEAGGGAYREVVSSKGNGVAARLAAGVRVQAWWRLRGVVGVACGCARAVNPSTLEGRGVVRAPSGAASRVPRCHHRR